jgi:putative aminopeptidase FrvX
MCLWIGLTLPAACQTITFNPVAKDLVLARLHRIARNNRDRAVMLKTMFAEAGCTSEHLEEQPVKGLKAPNIICTWPGATDRRILVSAHTDKVEMGDGAVDDWSGASLLVDLFESLLTIPRRHTFVFIGFSGEEEELAGSRFYVKKLAPAQKTQIAALVNVECLGLSGTAVWLNHADRQLAKIAGQTAAASKLPIQATNVDRVGRDDAMSFAEKHIPTITFHSLTQETLSILHSSRDKVQAIHVDEYYDSYRFLTAYLAFADAALQ